MAARAPERARPVPEPPAGVPVPAGAPLVSHIMPVWRPRVEWLTAAVRSVLGQRNCRIELVVVDDGCPQPVAELLREVRDPRLRCIRIEHGGVGRARNAGIAAARGSRLRFVDADDVLDPDSSAHLVKLMGDDEDVVTYGATMVCDAELRPWGRKRSRLAGRAEVACLLDRFPVTIHGLLFSRPVIDAIGGWEPSISVCEDWDFTLRALEHARVRGDDRIAVYYRKHSQGAWGDAEARWQGALSLTRRYFERHPEHRGTRLERRSNAMLDIIRAKRETAGRPWRDAAFWRAGLVDPGAALRALESPLRREARAWRRTIGRTLPPPVRQWLRDRRKGREYTPPPGWVRFGDLRRLSPISRKWGLDRGSMPVDRYYVEVFLRRHSDDIQGHVLEIKDADYTRRFGGDRVRRSDVLHVEPGHPEATIVADLTRGDELPSDAFDCIILTQTLPFIYDIHAALRTLHRILKPGGVLLVTAGGITPISPGDMRRWGHYWSFTTLSLRRLLEEVFPAERLEVEAYGNVLAATAFLYGLAREELRQSELDGTDPNYQLVISARAVKPAPVGDG